MKFHYRKKKSNQISIEEMVSGIKKGDRSILAKAITLVESNHPDHFASSQKLLQEILPSTGKSLRIGITGIPGAGKSTFIEKLGTQLCEAGKKVAVLAVDPSSSISKGSILGDKTRMEELSRNEKAFIRPSPTEGNLGGVHRKTRESILLCEAAGYNVIFVETVGVGQSEIVVETMVDVFILLSITGAGDELQGMKKGILELCDLIVITKADGENKQRAVQTKNEYNKFLRFLKPRTEGWNPRALTSSALTGEGIEEVWGKVQEFSNHLEQNGLLALRRKQQTREWLSEAIVNQLKQSFFQNQQVKNHWDLIQKQVTEGDLPVSTGVHELLSIYFENMDIKDRS